MLHKKFFCAIYIGQRGKSGFMMNKEIGGYIELDTYTMPMLHKKALALNCGRNALAYLIRSRAIKKLYLPVFICSSVIDVCKREGTEVEFYHVGFDFKPVNDFKMSDGDWLYIVNYYGQLTDCDIRYYAYSSKNIIVDQAQSYFDLPIDNIDTLYTCRKYFGVADGAFLYTDSHIDSDLPTDESYDRMRFLLGRFERTASEFYSEYVKNNHFFVDEPIKKMSKLTANLLKAIDYDQVEKVRKNNFEYLHKEFCDINQLKILKTGTFMYPLMIENGNEIRKQLQKEKIYIPTLWPTVFDLSEPNDPEYQMAQNIMPLPIDQRYTKDDMKYIVMKVTECLKN